MDQSGSIALSASRDPERTLFWDGGRAVCQGRLFADASSLAEALPERPYVLNLCDGRHGFLAGTLAAILRGQTVVLPNDRSRRFAEQLEQELPELYAISDHACSDHPYESLDVTPSLGRGCPLAERLRADDRRGCLMVFTSGSTGKPQPHLKSLGMLRFVARSLVDRFDLGGGTVVATVPSQHMYGLETSIALPLWSTIGVHVGRPFYPADVARALDEVPGPRILVTTPIHMRALLASDVSLPPLHMTISATAPLSREMAAQFEQRFKTQIHEIFGFSEAGTVATRRTVNEAAWLACDGLTFRVDRAVCRVHGAQFPAPIPLNDLVDLLAPNRFLLRRRASDNVNVAGKRTSLAGLNAVLNAIDGVVDGTFYLEDEGEAARPARLIAFVVAPDASVQDIREALRKALDPVFVPRRIYRVPGLPRNDNGKLTQAALVDLAARVAGAA